jgi:hypothetical protein
MTWRQRGVDVTTSQVRANSPFIEDETGHSW